MLLVQIGHNTDRLTLFIHGRVVPDSQDYWDANWLHCTAEVSTGSLHGNVNWQLRNEDLARFMREIEGIERGSDHAHLDTLDSWLDVWIIRDQTGNFMAECYLSENSADRNEFEFQLSVDKATLAEVLHQLRIVLHEFPVLGRQIAG